MKNKTNKALDHLENLLFLNCCDYYGTEFYTYYRDGLMWLAGIREGL